MHGGRTDDGPVRGATVRADRRVSRSRIRAARDSSSKHDRLEEEQVQREGRQSAEGEHGQRWRGASFTKIGDATLQNSPGR